MVLKCYRPLRATLSKASRYSDKRPIGELSDPRPTPEEQTISNESFERVRSAMRQLPRAHREVLLLLVMGYLQREMAEVLGKPLKSMGGRIRRARLALKKSMEEQNHEES